MEVGQEGEYIPIVSDTVATRMTPALQLTYWAAMRAIQLTFY